MITKEKALEALEYIVSHQHIPQNKIVEHYRIVKEYITKSGWMPIVTAPKDGTKIWAYEPSHPYSTSCVMWFGKDINYEDEGEMWLSGDGDDWSTGYYYTPRKPTHWQPLPPAPEEKK